LRSTDLGTGLVAVLVGAALVSAAGLARAAGVTTCSRREETFCATTHALSILHLSHRQVIAASESVYIDGSPAESGLHYEIDYAHGLVNVPGGLRPGSCLRISYKVFPFLLKADYSLRRLDRARRDGAGPAVGGPGPSDPGPSRRAPDYSLRASGSKTVAIEAGTLGGVKVDQSLSLSLGGDIGKSVSVVGVLSDKDFGFDRAGGTENLTDLDKVFIEVRSAAATARVGDIEMAQAPGELLSFERNLTGFYASASRGRSGIRASAASSRTTTRSVVIEGREGISGPYVVTGDDGLPVEMVPNSERVWVDGMAMRRGKGMDYTVDYSTGAIYFSPSRSMREASRIVVDYEVQDRDGGRQLYYAASDLALGENASVGLTVVSERFSPVALVPEAGSPGAPDLGAAGGAGWLDGGRYVGPGKGDFVKVEAGSTFHYEYVGDSAGDYEVSFSRVEPGEGDYAYVFSEAWQKHIYLYAAAGDYVAMVAPRPETVSQVVHLAGTGSLGEKVEFKAEGALSRSRGRVDAASPGEVSDGAYVVRVRGESALPDLAGVDAGAVEFEVNRRSVGAGFETFGRIRNPDFVEVWGLKPSSVYEETEGVNIGYKRGAGMSADVGLGRMHTDAGRSSRKHARLAFGGRGLGLTAMTDVVDVTPADGGAGGILRRGVDLRAPIGPASVNLGGRSEERTLGDGPGAFRRNEIYSEIRLPGLPRHLRAELSRIRESRLDEAAWRDYSTVTEGRVEFDARKGSLLEVRGVLAQSRIAYSEAAGLDDGTSTACDLAVSFRDLYMLSALTFDYGLASTLTTLYETEVIEVGAGGDYDSLGDYVTGGGYTISRREVGRAPVTRLRSRLVMETGRSGKILHKRRFTTRTEVAVEGESVDSSIRRAALPGYRDLTQGENMMLGRVTLSEQIVLSRLGNNTVTADFRGTRGQDRRCQGRLERFAQDRVQVRLISNAFDKTTVAVEAELRSSRNTAGTGAQVVERRLDARSARMEIERPLSGNVRGLLAVKVERQESTAPSYDVTEAALGPGLTMYAGDLRCDARVNIRRVLGGGAAGAGYYGRDSVDWNARLSFNHTRFTSLSVEYTGTRVQDMPALHKLRASVNAAF